MGKMFKIYLCGDRVYSCSTCRTHLAKHDQIVSKVSPRACVRACAGMARVCSMRGPRGAKWYPAPRPDAHARAAVQAFQGRHGRAFLFSNVYVAPARPTPHALPPSGARCAMLARAGDGDALR